jgi:phenylacetate-CoA ligase
MRRRRLALLSLLHGHPHLSRSRVVAFQRDQLRRVVRHAAEAVPYYRRLLERHGVRPEQITGPADLGRIPLTAKRDVQRADPLELVVPGMDPARLIAHRTSGWSGEPITIRRTWVEERLYVAARRRAMRDLGLRRGDRWAALGLVRPPHPLDDRLPQRIWRALGLYPRTVVDALAPPAEIAATLARLRPDLVTGYPGVIERVAWALAGDNGGGARPRLVVTGGEVLTPVTRERIARAFGATVREIYGSHECPLIAWECVRGHGLHVWDYGVVLEVVRDGRPARPGERGEVVITALHSFAMPFIRYVLGDEVVLGETPCPCGAPFATIRAVEGRTIDYFPLANGRLVHPYELVLATLGAAGAWLAQYRLLQESPERVVLTVAPLRPPSADELARLETAVRAPLGEGVDLRVDVVSEITLEPSGKFRVSRSLVGSWREDLR